MNDNHHRKLVGRLWTRADKNWNGTINLQKIRSLTNPLRHIIGRRSGQGPPGMKRPRRRSLWVASSHTPGAELPALGDLHPNDS